jgi:hypothetical protein
LAIPDDSGRPRGGDSVGTATGLIAIAVPYPAPKWKLIKMPKQKMPKRRFILPAGGPLGIDRRLAEVLFLAQIEVWSGSDGSSVQAAADRRDALLQEVDDHQRDFIRQIAESLARIA